MLARTLPLADGRVNRNPACDVPRSSNSSWADGGVLIKQPCNSPGPNRTDANRRSAFRRPPCHPRWNRSDGLETPALLIRRRGIGLGMGLPASHSTCTLHLPTKVPTPTDLRGRFRDVGGAFGLRVTPPRRSHRPTRCAQATDPRGGAGRPPRAAVPLQSGAPVRGPEHPMGTGRTPRSPLPPARTINRILAREELTHRRTGRVDALRSQDGDPLLVRKSLRRNLSSHAGSRRFPEGSSSQGPSDQGEQLARHDARTRPGQSRHGWSRLRPAGCPPARSHRRRPPCTVRPP
jgi:hypothetical protein